MSSKETNEPRERSNSLPGETFRKVTIQQSVVKHTSTSVALTENGDSLRQYPKVEYHDPSQRGHRGKKIARPTRGVVMRGVNGLEFKSGARNVATATNKDDELWEKAVRELELVIAQKDTVIENLSRVNKKLSGDVEWYEGSLEECRVNITTLEDKVKESEGLQWYKETLRIAEEKVRTLEDKLKESESEGLQWYKETIRIAEEKARTLEDKLKQTQEDIAWYKGTLKDSEERVRTLEDKIKTVEGNSEDLECYKRTLRDSEEEVRTLEGKLKGYEAKIKDLEWYKGTLQERDDRVRELEGYLNQLTTPEDSRDLRSLELSQGAKMLLKNLELRKAKNELEKKAKRLEGELNRKNEIDSATKNAVMFRNILSIVNDFESRMKKSFNDKLLGKVSTLDIRLSRCVTKCGYLFGKVRDVALRPSTLTKQRDEVVLQQLGPELCEQVVSENITLELNMVPDAINPEHEIEVNTSSNLNTSPRIETLSPKGTVLRGNTNLGGINPSVAQPPDKSPRDRILSPRGSKPDLIPANISPNLESLDLEAMEPSEYENELRNFHEALVKEKKINDELIERFLELEDTNKGNQDTIEILEAKLEKFQLLRLENKNLLREIDRLEENADLTTIIQQSETDGINGDRGVQKGALGYNEEQHGINRYNEVHKGSCKDIDEHQGTSEDDKEVEGTRGDVKLHKSTYGEPELHNEYHEVQRGANEYHEIQSRTHKGPEVQKGTSEDLEERIGMKADYEVQKAMEENRMSEYEDLIGSLRSALETKEFEAKELREKAGEDDELIEELRANVQREEKWNRELQRKYEWELNSSATKDDQMEEFQDCLWEREKTVRQLQEQLEFEDKRCEELLEKLIASQKDTEEYEVLVENLQRKLEDKEKRIKEFCEQNDKDAVLIGNLSAESTQLRKDVEHLMKARKDLEEDVETLNSSLKEAEENKELVCVQQKQDVGELISVDLEEEEELNSKNKDEIIEELQENLVALTSDVKEIEFRMEEGRVKLEDELTEAKDIRKQKEKCLDEALERYREMEEVCESLRQKIAQKDEQISEQEAEIARKREEIETREMRIEELSKICGDSSQCLNGKPPLVYTELEMEEVNELLEQERELSQTYCKSIELLENELNTYAKNIEILKMATENELQGMKTNFEKEVELGKNELAKVCLELNDKDKLLESARKEVEESNYLLQKTREEVDARDKMLEETRKDVHARDKMLQETRDEIEAKDKLLTETREQVHASDTLLENTRDEVRTKDNLLDKTREELNGTREKLHARDNLLKKARDEVHARENVLEETRKRLHARDKLLENTRKELHARDNLLKQKRKELQDHEDSLNITRLELDTAREETDKRRGEMDKTREELDKTRKELDKTRKELDKTREELDKTRKELDKTREELDKTRKEALAARGNLHAENELLEKTREELQATKTYVLKQDGDFASKEKALTECREDLGLLQFGIEVLEKGKQELGGTLLDNEEELGKMRGNLDELSKHNESLRESLNIKDEEIKRKEFENSEELAVLHVICQNLDKDKQKLERSNQELGSTLRDNESKMCTLRDNLEKSLKTINSLRDTIKQNEMKLKMVVFEKTEQKNELEILKDGYVQLEKDLKVAQANTMNLGYAIEEYEARLGQYERTMATDDKEIEALRRYIEEMDGLVKGIRVTLEEAVKEGKETPQPSKELKNPETMDNNVPHGTIVDNTDTTKDIPGASDDPTLVTSQDLHGNNTSHDSVCDVKTTSHEPPTAHAPLSGKLRSTVSKWRNSKNKTVVAIVAFLLLVFLAGCVNNSIVSRKYLFVFANSMVTMAMLILWRNEVRRNSGRALVSENGHDGKCHDCGNVIRELGHFEKIKTSFRELHEKFVEAVENSTQDTLPIQELYNAYENLKDQVDAMRRERLDIVMATSADLHVNSDDVRSSENSNVPKWNKILLTFGKIVLVLILCEVVYIRATALPHLLRFLAYCVTTITLSCGLDLFSPDCAKREHAKNAQNTVREIDELNEIIDREHELVTKQREAIKVLEKRLRKEFEKRIKQRNVLVKKLRYKGKLEDLRELLDEDRDNKEQEATTDLGATEGHRLKILEEILTDKEKPLNLNLTFSPMFFFMGIPLTGIMLSCRYILLAVVMMFTQTIVFLKESKYIAPDVLPKMLRKEISPIIMDSTVVLYACLLAVCLQCSQGILVMLTCCIVQLGVHWWTCYRLATKEDILHDISTNCLANNDSTINTPV